MIGPFKPKPGQMVGKHPSFAQEVDMSDPLKGYRSDAQNMAAERLISAIQAGDNQALLVAFKNLMALVDDDSQEDSD